MNSMNEESTEIIASSPCTDNCVMDAQGICMGCHRSAEEISKWFFVSNQERLAFLKNAYQRQKTKLEK